MNFLIHDDDYFSLIIIIIKYFYLDFEKKKTEILNN